MELKRRGVTAVVVATETFAPLIRAQAKARKVEPTMVIVKHPVGGLNAEELKGRVDEAVKGLQSFLD